MRIIQRDLNTHNIMRRVFITRLGQHKSNQHKRRYLALSMMSAIMLLALSAEFHESISPEAQAQYDEIWQRFVAGIPPGLNAD